MNKFKPSLSQEEFSKLYQKIQREPLTFDEKSLAKYISLSREDARLAEIVTEHIRDCWWKYIPKILNKNLKEQKFPNSVLLILDQIITLCAASDSTRKEFEIWANDVRIKIYPPKIKELFFITLAEPNTPLFEEFTQDSIPLFEKLNFWGRDILFNKQIPKKILSQDEFNRRYDL